MSREPSATEPAAQATGIAYRWLLRGSTIALAAAALAWIAAIAPDVTNPAVPQIAGRVARGERYEVDRLRRIVSDNLPSARRLCSAKTLRELLLLQLAIADESTRAGDLKQIDLDADAVASTSRALLACAPTEGLGWFGSYWAEIRQAGFGPRTAELLGLSYRFAPHEAWLQLIRAPLALRAFNAASPELRDYATQDFADIFQARLFPSAATFYQAAGTEARAALLERTCTAPEADRELFSHFVAEKGLRIRHRCYPADGDGFRMSR
ncbi:hypothetical protein ABIF65_000325 [Bradyrhizobium japonicum]|jgi:hypothetical protein|uniref:hypothetical protein n=1 Tax=Bradyrhizobium TaxID=374 RepID=UPI0004B1B8E0|nr:MULTISPECIES: hypothetical protein [Bradyrhizobium]MBR0945681.1 hypothetical protein [Bradyrhizobium liaoningense]MBR1031617.1 hypothetical protein [Bradyrhizobium liaoningense]MBR1064778.1 hypothetical protein [Bradyrhizobium liaoningense]MDI2074841.1 hypothetical protein [Bradyrhizobium sp. Mp27]